MGNRKSHHYIPRFYLRQFSVMEEGKCIGLFDLPTKRFVGQASIKHNACADYLYGTDDEIESGLARLEGAIASFFKCWTEERIFIPPPPESNGMILLKRFILYQMFRTPKAGKWIENSTKEAFEVYKQVVSANERKKLDAGKIITREPVLEALVRSVEFEHLLGYLECRFLVNLSDLLFITSDSPVVLYNQFMEKQGLYLGSTALAIKGLQIFYPIHPRLMLVFYDPVTYLTETTNCISTDSVQEVHQLNSLQFINCQSQLFFDERITQEYIEKLVEEYPEERRNGRNVTQMILTAENKYRYFTAVNHRPIKLNLASLSLLPIDENFDGGLSPLRHPSFERKKSAS